MTPLTTEAQINTMDQDSNSSGRVNAKLRLEMGAIGADVIPDEVWEMLICPHLPTVSLVSLSMVSARFRDISRAVTPFDVVSLDGDIYSYSESVGHAEAMKVHWPLVKTSLTRNWIDVEDTFTPAEHARVCELYARMGAALHSLTIKEDEMLSDVRVFSSVHTLALVGCPAIKDVSPLASVRNLNLSYCEGVTDISPLWSVQSLSFTACQGVTDVSALGSVRDLSLTGCQGITDISALATVPRLTLVDCSLGISDFSMLGNQEYLNLEFTSITSVSHLGSVRDLSLKQCPRVTDISALADVPQLSLFDCCGISDFSMLGNQQYLNLTLTAITSVCHLGSVRDLNLSWCPGVADISALANVPRLTLNGCVGISDFSMLGSHEYLNLSNTNVTSVSHLGTVRDLKLGGCRNITTTMKAELREEGVRVIS